MTYHYTATNWWESEEMTDEQKAIDCFSLKDLGVQMTRKDKNSVVRVVALEQLNTNRRVVLVDYKRGATSILVAYRIYKDKDAVRVELPDRQLNAVRAMLMQNNYEPMLLDVPKAFSFFKEHKDMDILTEETNSRFYEMFKE
jgi:hypothetical protein